MPLHLRETAHGFGKIKARVSRCRSRCQRAEVWQVLSNYGCSGRYYSSPSLFLYSLWLSDEENRSRRLSRTCKTVSLPSSSLAPRFPILTKSPPCRFRSREDVYLSSPMFSRYLSLSLSLSPYAPLIPLDSPIQRYDPDREPPLTSCNPRYNTRPPNFLYHTPLQFHP